MQKIHGTHKHTQPLEAFLENKSGTLELFFFRWNYFAVYPETFILTWKVVMLPKLSGHYGLLVSCFELAANCWVVQLHANKTEHPCLLRCTRSIETTFAHLVFKLLLQWQCAESDQSWSLGSVWKIWPYIGFKAINRDQQNVKTLLMLCQMHLQ